MKAVKTISAPKWMNLPETKAVMEAIGGYENPPRSLFVGGAVRNELIGLEVGDIDIATQLAPDDVMARLQEAGLKAVPTGIDHGTVTAVSDGRPYEITTLRKDVETDGRRAVVAFTEDWLEDAQRRDFTMNTLLAGPDGQIYDPTGQGVADLEARRVIFVGAPAQRIAEDYLRILRFFRFHAQYGEGGLDPAGLAACREAAPNISTLSRERITQECLKILSVGNPTPTIQNMRDNNILDDVIHPDFEAKVLQTLCALQVKHSSTNIMARLFVVGGCSARLFDEALRLSHAQMKSLIKLEMLMGTVNYSEEKTLKKAIFYHGNELVLQGYLLAVAKGDAPEDKVLADLAVHWRAPECPITGQTLLDEGYKTGPELGRELEYRQEEWLDENI